MTPIVAKMVCFSEIDPDSRTLENSAIEVSGEADA